MAIETSTRGVAITIGDEHGHNRRTPLTPFLTAANALVVHKRIEDAHVGRPLTGIILKVEQLIACHVGGAKIELNIGLVELGTPTTRSLVISLSLIAQASILKTLTEDFEIVGIEHTRIFLNFVEVGIDLELTRLMADDRNIAQLTAFFECTCRTGTEMIEHTSIGHIGKRERTAGVGIVVAPAFTSDTTGGEIVHPRLHALIAQVIVGTKGVELVGTNGTEILDETFHGVDASP